MMNGHKNQQYDPCDDLCQNGRHGTVFKIPCSAQTAAECDIQHVGKGNGGNRQENEQCMRKGMDRRTSAKAEQD